MGRGFVNADSSLRALALSIVPVRTVTFDVGGRLHKVRNSFISLNQNNVIGRLGQIALDRNVDEPIFIDRDGDIFIYVLNFLRDGRIELPMTVAKQAFMNELRYYGIDCSVGRVTQFVTPVVCLDLGAVALIACFSLLLSVSMKKH